MSGIAVARTKEVEVAPNLDFVVWEPRTEYEGRVDALGMEVSEHDPFGEFICPMSEVPIDRIARDDSLGEQDEETQVWSIDFIGHYGFVYRPSRLSSKGMDLASEDRLREFLDDYTDSPIRALLDRCHRECAMELEGRWLPGKNASVVGSQDVGRGDYTMTTFSRCNTVSFQIPPVDTNPINLELINQHLRAAVSAAFGVPSPSCLRGGQPFGLPPRFGPICTGVRQNILDSIYNAGD